MAYAWEPGTKRSAPCPEEPRKQSRPEESCRMDIASPPPSPAQSGFRWQQGPNQGEEVDRLALMLKSLEEDIINELPEDEATLREFPHLRSKKLLREARLLAHSVLNGLSDEREEMRASRILERERPDWYLAQQRREEKEKLEKELQNKVKKKKEEKSADEGDHEECEKVVWTSDVVMTPVPRDVCESILQAQPQPSCSYSVKTQITDKDLGRLEQIHVLTDLSSMSRSNYDGDFLST